MSRTFETSVLIVGAGPVGLTLAMDLSSRGIDVTVIEMRRAGEPPNVKCNQVSARSMEIFRRLGLAGDIRANGLPEDYRNDVVCCISATGSELSRIKLPSRAGRLRGEQGDDSWWPTPEPPHRINQLFLEPILFTHAVAQPRIRILNRTQFEEFNQDDAGRHGDRQRSRHRRAYVDPLPLSCWLRRRPFDRPPCYRRGNCRDTAVSSAYSPPTSARQSSRACFQASQLGCIWRSTRGAAAP